MHMSTKKSGADGTAQAGAECGTVPWALPGGSYCFPVLRCSSVSHLQVDRAANNSLVYRFLTRKYKKDEKSCLLDAP